MSETPAADITARTIAEHVYVAYARQATAPAERLAEQNAVTRLVEAIVPALEHGPEAVVGAVNGALDSWEAREPGLGGPRVGSVDLADCAVSMRAA